MIVVNVEESERVENPHGVDVRKLIGTERAQALHVTLGPVEALEGHAVPVDAFPYVIKGKGTVEVGDERAEVKKGSAVYLPREVPHAVKNSGSMRMCFLVVKVG